MLRGYAGKQVHARDGKWLGSTLDGTAVYDIYSIPDVSVVKYGLKVSKTKNLKLVRAVLNKKFFIKKCFHPLGTNYNFPPRQRVYTKAKTRYTFCLVVSACLRHRTLVPVGILDPHI